MAQAIIAETALPGIPAKGFPSAWRASQSQEPWKQLVPPNAVAGDRGSGQEGALDPLIGGLALNSGRIFWSVYYDGITRDIAFDKEQLRDMHRRFLALDKQFVGKEEFELVFAIIQGGSWTEKTVKDYTGVLHTTNCTAPPLLRCGRFFALSCPRSCLSRSCLSLLFSRFLISHLRLLCPPLFTALYFWGAHSPDAHICLGCPRPLSPLFRTCSLLIPRATALKFLIILVVCTISDDAVLSAGC